MVSPSDSRMNGGRTSRKSIGELAGLRSEVLAAVVQPERVLLGGDGELIAVRELEEGKHLVVIYREEADDGFIITAFLTRRVRSLAKRRQVWP